MSGSQSISFSFSSFPWWKGNQSTLMPLDQLLKEFLTKKKEGKDTYSRFTTYLSSRGAKASRLSSFLLPLSPSRLIAPFLWNSLIQVSKEVSSSSPELEWKLSSEVIKRILANRWPAYEKHFRDTDPREDIGPSSVRQRVDSANAAGAGENVGPSQQAPNPL